MMKWLALCLEICLLVSQSEEAEDCMRLNNLVYQKHGNLSITGIFDGHTREMCTQEAYKGLEEMAAAAWTITALEDYRYIRGLKLGLSIFDACGSEESSSRTLVQESVHQACFRDKSYFIGTLISPEIDDRVNSLSKTMNKPLNRVERLLDLNTQIEMILQLLTNIRWTTVNRVISDNEPTLEIFSKMTSDEGICVYDEVLIVNKHAVNNKLLYPEHLLNESIVATDRPVIVVIARSDLITQLILGLGEEIKNASARWILLPTDAAFDLPVSHSHNILDDTIVLLPLIERKEKLPALVKNLEVIDDYLNHREITKSPIFLNVASSILQLLEPFKRIEEESCPGMDIKSNEPCPEVVRQLERLMSNEIRITPPRSLRLSPERIEPTLRTLRIENSDSDEMFLYVATLLGNKSEDLAMFQIFDIKSKILKPILLIVNDKLLNEYPKVRDKRTNQEPMFKIDFDDINKVRRRQQLKERQVQEHSDGEPLSFALYDRSVGNFTTNQKSSDEDIYSKTDDIDLVLNFPRHPCSEILKMKGHNLAEKCGICQNLIKYHVKSVQKQVQEREEIESFIVWRSEIWVTINASIASVGLFCTLTVIVFLLVRLCKGDILEGSPYFSFLILLAITLIYSSILPFSVEMNEKSSSWLLPICDLRIIGPTLSYSILFSIMLSRSLMLASSDQEGGFMSHVNGYLQTVLCFFMCGVQIALSSQYWLFNSYLHNSRNDLRCLEMYHNHGIIILLGYSYFLILILTCICPFIFRSKRNYKEGLFFTLSIFLILAVWSVWITLYFSFPLEKKDAAVAFGLTGTATTILACVFVPRTYLIMTAIVRYKIASSLPQLNCNSTGDFSEINYRSNQALYDSVKVRRQNSADGLHNSTFYTANQTENSRAASVNENFYATDSTLKIGIPNISDSIGSRRKIFGESRPHTPENMYETSYNAPRSPKRVTKF